MNGIQIDVKGFTDLIMDEIKKDVALLPFLPSYTCYIVADENGNFDPASEKYVGLKHKTSTLSGIDCVVKKLTYDEFKTEMIRLSLSDEPARAMLQLPTRKDAVEMFNSFVKKGHIIDVDHLGDDVLHDMWDGEFDRMPATPRGVCALLDHIHGSLSGKKIALVGSRSKTTGRFLIPMLQHLNATVSLYHSRSHIRTAEFLDYDIIISCVGKAGFITESHLGGIGGKTLIDVGVSVVDGKVRGDFDDSCRMLDNSFTPYTSGVGLLTRIMLIRNVVDTYFIGVN